MSRKKKKKAKKQNKAFAGSFVARAVPQVQPRQCHWVVTAKADVTAFRALYGISRNYAGTTDRWCGGSTWRATAPFCSRRCRVHCCSALPKERVRHYFS